MDQNRFLNSKVAIIGAGVSGIVAAKQLRSFNPVVFEATDSIGGVWKHCSYRTTRLQTPRRDYEFSDFPWPENQNDFFPTHTEIVDYLYSYAKHFELLKFVKLNCKVVEIKFTGDRKSSGWPEKWGGKNDSANHVWELAVQTNQSETIQRYQFDFIVVCVGKYGDVPKVPSFPAGHGPENFSGQVLHSIDYSKLDKESAYRLLKGKKVVVIGYKKSALDLAAECAEANQGEDGQPCTMVIRTLHWIVPSYWIWGVPLVSLYATRFSQFFHERPDQSFFRSLLCRISFPVRQVVSRFVESYLVWKMPLQKYGLVPGHGFEEDYASCQMAILPENFFEAADEGRILFKRSSKWKFWSGGIELEDKTKVEADVVVLATGFDGPKKLKSILPEPFRNLTEDSSGVMPLYRGTIHPLIPYMAFVGYLESVSNLHTAELRCKWLAKLLNGKFELPSVEKMMDQTTQEMIVTKRNTRFYKRHCISTFSINHSDEICEEMGWSAWRKNSWLAEAFSPYSNQDYDEDI